MSEYTPTTDEVRDAYAGHDFDHAIAAAQFDRWLAEVERAAAEKAWTEGAHAQWWLGKVRLVSKIPVNPYRRNEGEKA